MSDVERRIEAATDVIDTLLSAERTQLDYRGFCRAVAEEALRESGYEAELVRLLEENRELRAALERYRERTP